MRIQNDTQLRPKTINKAFKPTSALRLGLLLLTSFLRLFETNAEVKISSLTRGNEQIDLHWSNGEGPYMVQISRDLRNWSDHGSLLQTNHTSVPAFADKAYFRIIELDPHNQFGALLGRIETDQGEFGSLLGRHRLKSRIWFFKSNQPPHTSESFTAQEFFSKLKIVFQSHNSSEVTSWTGSLEDLGKVTIRNNNEIVILWSRGPDQDLRSYTLTMTFPYSISALRTKPPLLSDPNYTLQCRYGSSQREIDFGSNRLTLVKEDKTTLYQLNPTNPNLTFPARRKYRILQNGVFVDLSFHEGLPLIQGQIPFIWKTFILDRWLEPTTGGGGTLPAFTTDSYFARTLFPGHHNFVENVLIDPMLDPTLPEVTRQAFVSSNIRYISTFREISFGTGEAFINYIGFDHLIRNP